MKNCFADETMHNRFSRYVTLLISLAIPQNAIHVGGEWTAHNILHEWMRRYRLKKMGLSNLRLNVEEIGGGSLQSLEIDYVGPPAR